MNLHKLLHKLLKCNCHERIEEIFSILREVDARALNEIGYLANEVGFQRSGMDYCATWKKMPKENIKTFMENKKSDIEYQSKKHND